MPIGRRAFLASFSAPALRPRPGRSATTEAAPQFRAEDPCPDLRGLVDPGSDRFEAEKRGAVIERTLNAGLLRNDLPLRPGFAGKSPMPARYVQRAEWFQAEYADGSEGFSDGLQRWIDSLGEVRRSEFHVLPEDFVRYEVASTTAQGLEYRVGRWRIGWQGGALTSFEPVEETLVRSVRPLFEDVTAQLFQRAPSVSEQLAKGIPYWRSRLDPATGISVYGNQGIAVGDIDGDGWDEVYVCQPGGLPNRLYSRGGDGDWLDITAQAGVGILDNTAQALFLDLRNSGTQDLVVLASGGPLLYVNDGSGKFRFRAEAFRFATEPRGTFAGMAAADYDRDGRLDLYLCSYLYFQSEDQYRYPVPYHDARNGPPNFLFRNRLRGDGSGVFEDVTAEAGMDENNDRYSFAAAWCDYDEDGWPELYVANDFGRNNLYKWTGGRFRDVAEREGLQDTGPGMSAAWFDYDRDGRLDLYVTNMWTPQGQRTARDPSFGPSMGGARQADFHGHTKGNSLYRNRTDGAFDYVGLEQGIEMGRWSWSGDGCDFDLDGFPEVLVTAGMITHAPDKDLGSFFWRRVVAASPVDASPQPKYEQGWNCLNQLVREDYSWNGGESNVFYVRKGGKFRDCSGVSGLDRALDSRAFAVTDFDGDGRPDLFLKSRLGPQLVAYRNQCSGRRRSIAFDLVGTESNRDAIGAIVKVSTADGVSAQSLSAGSGYISQHTKRLHFGLGSNAAAKAASVLWPSGLRQELGTLEAGFRYNVVEGREEVSRVPFEPRSPRETAGRPVEGRNDLGLDPTWLLDPVPLPVSAPEGFLFLTHGGLEDPPRRVPHHVVDLGAEVPGRAEVFALLRRYLFDYRAGLSLPFVMLVGAGSRIRKVYPVAPDQRELDRDWAILRAPASGEVGLSLPFEGHYHGAPRRNHYQLGSAFLEAGYSALALPYLQEAANGPSGSHKAWLAIGQIQLQEGRLEDAAASLETARAMNPDSPQLWNNLGGLAMAKDDLRAALESFRRALSLNPDLPYALVNAAQAHLGLGDPTAAERLLRRAVELDPTDADAASKLGLILAQSGRLGEARALFEQAIEHQRDHSEAINNLAVLYIQARQINDAIGALRYGIDQVPDFAPFYMNLARIHADRGDFAAARDVVSRLLERQPDHQAARRALLQMRGR